MPSLIGFPPINARVEKHVLSRGPTVARKKIGQILGTGSVAPIPLESIYRVFSENPGDALLAVSRPFLPTEVTDWFRFAGLSADPPAFCDWVIFCSHLEETVGTGLNKFAPYMLPEGEALKTLTQNDFLPSLEKAVFINSFAVRGERLSGLGIFRSLLFPLGHIKAGISLTLKGAGPQLIRPELKAYLAAQYELEAVVKLLEYLDSEDCEVNDAAQFSALISSQWQPQALSQFLSAYKLLAPNDLMLILPLTMGATPEGYLPN